MTAPINPIPLGNTASVLTPQELSTYQNFFDLPERLQAMSTVFMYIDPLGNVFHLNGPLAGTEGVQLAQVMQGEHHLPIDQIVTESAYQLGATLERTNIVQRLINLRITIGAPGMNNYLYRYCEDRWWAGQVENRPGWLGCFTRFSGWRWIQVYPAKTIDTAIRQDPVAYGNNMATWDITWIAPIPYYSKPAAFNVWSAAASGPPDVNGNYFGTIALVNRGDMETYVQYLIKGDGVATVQDGTSTRMVTLPHLLASDGVGLCNTDPTERTLLAEADPIDNLFYKIIRASKILNFFLSNIGTSGEPWWLRGYTRFLHTVEPLVVTHYTVMHTNPNATITVIVPPRFRRSR